MALIDKKLEECNLRRVTTYKFIVGDCLFDSISYLLGHEISSILLRKNSMNHLANCLVLNTPKALQTRNEELNPEWLHDLHVGVYNEHDYIRKMALSASNGGLWGDFTAIKWISDYLQKPIYVWLNDSAKIISISGQEFESEPLHLAFGSSHYEPIEKLHQTMPIMLPNDKRCNTNNCQNDVIDIESSPSHEIEVLNSQGTWIQDVSNQPNLSSWQSNLNEQCLNSGTSTKRFDHGFNNSKNDVVFTNEMYTSSFPAATNETIIKSEPKLNMDQNLVANINKKSKRMYWTVELNDLLRTLMSKYATTSEIATNFLLQKNQLDLTMNQVMRHIRNLKSGNLKSNMPMLEKSQVIDSHITPIDVTLHSSECCLSTKKRPYTRWKEMDDELEKILNNDPNNTYVDKANSFVTKNPTIGKTAIQIVKRMKLLSSKMKVNPTLIQKEKKEINDHFVKYHIKLNDTPTFVCELCERYNFLSSSTLINEKILFQINSLLHRSLELKQDENLYVCNICLNCVKNEKIPFYCVPNNISRNSIITSVKQLTSLEERLISPRLAFAQIHRLYNYGQYKLHGSIVNVPANIDLTQSILPRLPEDGTTIGVLLKRRLEYKSPYMAGNIRPNMTMLALKDLIKTPLYKECNVSIRPQWNSLFSLHIQSNMNLDIQCDTMNANDFEEEIDNPPSETLVHNFLESDKIHDFDKMLSVAPGQEYSPIGIFKDKFSEELNHPTLFYGHPRNENINENFSYHQIASWEILHKDHDFATNIENIFFKAIKICIQKVKNSGWIRIRKGKLCGRRLTAGQVVEEPNLDKLLQSHIGFRDLEKLRTSPDYVEGLRKNLFAMIRQLGPPTFFITLTSAERLWTPLIEALYKLNSKRLNLPPFDSLESIHIAELIRSDPVTCALYYNNRTKAFRDLLIKESSILGEVLDFFFITEFQHRGSEHEHAVIWVKNAPQFRNNSNKEIESFVDKYISSDKSLLPVALQEAQTHKHSRTCKKKGHSICRFHYPLPPMNRTMVLEPLGETNVSKLSLLKNKAKEIFTYLQNVEAGSEVEFDEFISKFQIDEQTYILVLCSQLKRPQVFLKRSLSNICTNAFNKIIAHNWYANTDVQFILDPYAAATYCTSYMTKVDKTITVELKSILQKCIGEKTDANLRILKLGNAFLNAQQMSAQLAIYLILSIPLYHCSRSFSFINTSPSHERAFILKPQYQLLKLDKECTEVMCKSIIDKYIDRPDNLENICLAAFVADYNHSKNKISIRKKSKIIRFVHYNKIKDMENWCREQLLLYVPFNKFEESLKIGKETWKEAYDEQVDIVTCNRNKFNYQIHKHSLKDCGDEWINLQDFANELVLSKDFDIWKDASIEETESVIISMNAEKYDLASDIYIKPKFTNTYKNTSEDNNNVLELMKSSEYLGILRSLNEEQRSIYDDIMYRKRTFPNESLYLFLTGGAGSGKTYTLHAIIQGLLRIYHKDLHSNPLKAKALLMAYTGKAAFNINGTTIHSALHIPINQSLENLNNLSSEMLNKLTDQYEELRFIVLDEVSLVGARMLHAIDQRLRSIMHVQNKVFGGLDVIVTGDFYQAPPVRDKWVFQQLDFGLNAIAPNFWREYMKCYELKTIVRQNDPIFINILNRFRKATHTTGDVEFLNNLCLKKPPESSIIPYLYYTNPETSAHNNREFMKSTGPTFNFEAVDIRHHSLPSTFKIPDNPNKTAGLQTTIKVKKDMLVELTHNYATSDGLVHGADGLFKSATSINNKTYVWIKFFNEKIGTNARFTNAQLYQNQSVDSTWTPIESVSKEINLSKNNKYLLTRIQFPIQLAAARTIHRSQGLSLDDVAFNPTNINKHGLTYTALSRVRTKEKLYLLAPLTVSNFRVDACVTDEMNRLNSIAKWEFLVPRLQTMRHSHIIIQSININSLKKHHIDYKSDHNMQAAHILCFQETKVEHANEIINYIDTSRYKYIHAYDKHGILLMYEHRMICVSCNIETYNGSEFIVASFNLGTRNAIHVVTVYRSHSTKLKKFLEILQQLIYKAPNECPIIILGDFNVDVSQNTTQKYDANEILHFMNDHCLYQKLLTSTTKNNSLIDHIWTNIPGVDAKYGVTDAYWPDYHKPIYCAFKLPTTLPKFSKNTTSLQFI